MTGYYHAESPLCGSSALVIIKTFLAGPACPLIWRYVRKEDKMKVTVFVISMITFIAGCNSINYSALVTDSNKTMTSFYSDKNKDETLYNIPDKYWIGELKNLNPISVYNDRVNIVIVLKKFKNDEEGLYIFPNHSSYIPVNNDEWKFKQIKDQVCRYKRTKKTHNPQIN